MAEYGRNRATAQNDTTRLVDIYGPAAEGLGLATGYRLNGNGNNFMAGANYALTDNVLLMLNYTYSDRHSTEEADSSKLGILTQVLF